MSMRGRDQNLSRRGLLKGATMAGVAAVSAPRETRAQAQPHPAGPITPAPNPAMESRPPEMPIVQGSSGSDYMADVIKSLGIEHVACNPGTSFRSRRMATSCIRRACCGPARTADCRCFT